MPAIVTDVSSYLLRPLRLFETYERDTLRDDLMAGLFQATLGFARLGMLVNFVSHSGIGGVPEGMLAAAAVKSLARGFLTADHYVE